MQKMMLKSQCQDTTLLYAVGDGKWLRKVTTESDLAVLVLVQLDHYLHKIGGHPSCVRISHNPVLLTESKALVRLTKVAVSCFVLGIFSGVDGGRTPCLSCL